MFRQRVAALFVVCSAVCTLLGFASPAEAHAELRSSDPSEGATLPIAPRRLTLTFTEGASAAQSSVMLGARRLPLTASPGDDKVLVADLSAVAVSLRGSISITWRSVSSDDGHVATGAIHFRIGVATPTPTEKALKPSSVQSGSNLFLYAAGLGAMCLIFGGLVFAATRRDKR
jgi:methionine-rich copper-binding protein CopC